MSRYISENIRALVSDRAENRCEYCLIHQEDMVFTFQIDHIISLKHGGTNEIDNLALTCSFCNQNKGTDLGTYLDSKRLVRLFNPRFDRWNQHLEYLNGEIIAKTKIGSATIKVLNMNDVERIILRRTLEEIGRYPL